VPSNRDYYDVLEISPGANRQAIAGVVLLALLTVSVSEPLARLVAARNVALGLANAVAAVGFAVFGPVRWAAAAPLAAGFLLGGGLGPGLPDDEPATESMTEMTFMTTRVAR